MKHLLCRTHQGDTGEEIPLPLATGRILFQDYHAGLDQPPYDRSPLDGFAMNHKDIAGASDSHPVILTINQSIYAGNTPARECSRMSAARIMTGAPLPPGADCVIRQEDVQVEEDRVIIRQSLKHHENFCFQGEEVRKGSCLLRRGDRMTPARLGILASQGFATVQVYKKPAVCVFSTGDELLSIGTPWQPGKIYDSNSLTLSARAWELGAAVTNRGHVPDHPGRLADTIVAACRDHRLIVTTGGVSVGAHDYMREVCEGLGAELIFHGIKAKPGSPAVAYQKDQTLILCLSGNPFAAFATFELLAVPVLKKLSGLTDPLPQRLEAVLTDDFRKASPNRRFVRARVNQGYVTLPACGHESGSLYALADCNCMLDIPAGSGGLETGSKVQVMMF